MAGGILDIPRRFQNDSVFVLEAVFEKAKATVTINRDAAGRLQFSGKLDATADVSLELARFHYLDGLLPTPETNLLSMRHYELPGRIIKPTEKVQAPLKSNWGWDRLNDPIHSRANIAISGDSGMLGSDWNTSGFFFGFTAPGSAFGELGMRTADPAPTFFLAVLLDAIRLDPENRACLKLPRSPMATTSRNSATGSAFAVMPSAPPGSDLRWSATAHGINSAKVSNPSTSAAPWMVSQILKSPRAAKRFRSTTASK